MFVAELSTGDLFVAEFCTGDLFAAAAELFRKSRDLTLGMTVGRQPIQHAVCVASRLAIWQHDTCTIYKLLRILYSQNAQRNL